MKKALLTLITATALLSMLVACGKKDEGGGGGGAVAQTPNTACNIPGDTKCTPTQYNQFGPQFTPYQWTNNGSFCGCPLGSRPVMNPQWGLSCAPASYFQGYGNSNGGNQPQYAQNQYYPQYQGGYQFQGGFQYQSQFQTDYQSQFQGYSYQAVSGYQQYAQNYQVSSIPQVTYSPAVSGQNGTCYTHAAAICDTSAPTTSCGAGSVCRASSGGSRVGFCAGGYSDATYEVPQQNCYRYQYNRWGFYSYVNVCGNRYGSYGNGNYGAR